MVVKCAFFIVSVAFPNSLLGADTDMVFFCLGHLVKPAVTCSLVARLV